MTPIPQSVIERASSGSQAAIQELSDVYGLSRSEMARYGARLEANGSIATSTPADLEALESALEILAFLRGALAAFGLDS